MKTRPSSRRRTSRLVGWTLTSTMAGSRVTSTTPKGWRPIGSSPAYASSTATTRARLWTRRRLITMTSPVRLPRWLRGSLMRPLTAISLAPSTAISSPASRPKTAAAVSIRLPPGLRSTNRSSLLQLKPTSGWVRARSETARTAAADSLRSVRRKASRAGVLWKRSQTSAVVPGARAAARCSSTSPARACSSQAPSSPAVRLVIRRSLTAAMLASASPRKPRLRTRARSSTVSSLEVAWRAIARRSWSPGMPAPSSATTMRTSPPASRSTSIRVAPASSAFSQSSLTAAAGRSTTSPAAMASATCGGRRRMGAVTDPSAPAARRAC